jgi:L-alanine-DL-glutamate epimerase-like enolase superfamily enzyme
MQKVFCVSVVVVLCACTNLLAQGDRGVITGTVKDSSGAVMPGAQVTAIHSATNVSYKANTTASGDFTVPSLPVGAYQVRIECQGFKTNVRENVMLTAGGTLRVDAQLEVGAMQQTVEVTANAQMLQVDRSRKGVALMAEHLLQVREAIGYDVPLSTDHFGGMGVNSIIKLGKAFEKANLAWMEDTVPWYRTDLLKQISCALDVPICTGEDIYLLPSFEVLCKEHAVDIIQPDPSTAGGILETKRIVDMAQTYGIPTAYHGAYTPVAEMAMVHSAAASEGFMVLENHNVDNPWWDSLVDGVPKPLVQKGFIPVPNGPGLGISLYEAAIKEHMDKAGGHFEPTTQWDTERSSDNIYS